ncbi:sensor histidine kinase [Scleromatobacter humisilvae]|uniref:histidine kinase n=1 Tax=Scleromatobacter humisilvae TaxID=2897159 RepID=A0A9X1YPB6_9BURK|nr:ATP-binding protein [Scleromatobacter humisilvae]MCK9685326.1 two-component sensor histidine kinase [Scleromatobacter humisilvae]
MNHSLRKRLSLWLSAAIVLMSATTAGVTFWMNYRDANDLQDTQLQQIAAALATQPVRAPRERFLPRDGEDAETHLVIRPLGSSDIDPNPRIDVMLPPSLAPGLHDLEASEVHWRVFVRNDVDGRAFGVAQRQHLRDEVARDNAVAALAPMFVLVPLLLLIVNLLLRQGFVPLVALSGEVDEGDVRHLKPLRTDRIPGEVLPLVHAVNRLLTRVGGLLEQQRRLVADAAHELRTPIAAARVQADNLAHADLTPDARERLESLQRGLARNSELVDQLLRLARVQGDAPHADQPIALDALTRSAIEETLALAESYKIDLGCIRLDRAQVRGDSLHAFALIRNAIDNAVRYTPPGGWVDVSLVIDEGDALLAIEDTGPGIPSDLRERVFEPFFRVLGTQQSGNGLGLAIVRSAADALGGRVELTTRLDGQPGLRFVYRQKLA